MLRIKSNAYGMMLHDEGLLHAKGRLERCEVITELQGMHDAPTVGIKTHVRFQTGKGSQHSELSPAA